MKSTEVPKMTTSTKRLIYKALEMVDRIFQVCIPCTSNRVIYASTPDYADNAYFQYRYLALHRDGLEHIWLIYGGKDLATRIELEFTELQRLSGNYNNRLRVVSRRSLSGYYCYLSSRVAFHTHGLYAFSRWQWRRHNVCLWHGMPIKSIGKMNTFTPNPFPTHGTLHLATSSFFRYIIASVFEVSPKRVMLSGLPRCDVLSYPALRMHSESTIRETLGVGSDQRLVFWMPTYRTERVQLSSAGSYRSFLDDMHGVSLADIDAAAGRNGCVVVIKLHPYDGLNQEQLPVEFNNLRFVTADQWNATGIPLYECLAIVDGLMSDVSSVLIDYLVTQRPIGIVGFKPETYTRDVLFSPNMLFASVLCSQVIDIQSLDNYMSAVAQREPIRVPANDISHVFNENLTEVAAEAIAQELSLGRV